MRPKPNSSGSPYDSELQANVERTVAVAALKRIAKLCHEFEEEYRANDRAVPWVLLGVVIAALLLLLTRGVAFFHYVAGGILLADRLWTIVFVMFAAGVLLFGALAYLLYRIGKTRRAAARA